MNNRPKVTIIINCHNGEKFLKQAIDSIYSQTFSDWEIVFWDNFSSDNTAEIAKSYDTKLKYFRSNGISSLGLARNLALLEARGEWVAFLDSDDLWEQNKLQIQIDALENKFHILCYAGVNEISEEGKILREVSPRQYSGNMLEKLLIHFDINMVTPILHLDSIKKLNLNFDENMYASEEYNLFIRVAAKGDILALPNILGSYRISRHSLTDAQIHRWSIERVYTLEQVIAENPKIESLYKLGFKSANIRSIYYESRYLMSIGDAFNARIKLRSIATENLQYCTLYLISYIPFLWRLIHNNEFKRIILKYLS